MTYHRSRPQLDEDHIVVIDIETISSETQEDGSFPPWPTHTPIVVSLLTADRDKEGCWTFDLQSVAIAETEVEDALELVDDALEGRSVVTYNGRGFDLPVLMLTAQKVRAFDLPHLTVAANENRYWSAKHYDLADKVSGYGAARGASLERLSSALGIPVKQATHGSDVASLHARGDINSILDYCDTDVCATLLAYAYQRAMETGDESYHASLTWQFAGWAAQKCLTAARPGTEERSFMHLAPYATLPNGAELQRLSLLTQLEAHFELARADARERERQAIEAEFGDPVPY